MNTVLEVAESASILRAADHGARVGRGIKRRSGARLTIGFAFLATQCSPSPNHARTSAPCTARGSPGTSVLRAEKRWFPHLCKQNPTSVSESRDEGNEPDVGLVIFLASSMCLDDRVEQDHFQYGQSLMQRTTTGTAMCFYRKSCISCRAPVLIVFQPVSLPDLDRRIRELCAKAVAADESELTAVLSQLRSALQEHILLMRGMAAVALKRAEEKHAP